MAIDPSKPTRAQRISRLQERRDELYDRLATEPRLDPSEYEELNAIERELKRLQETAQERAEREARDEASGLTGEEIDRNERAEDAGLTPAELEARDQKDRDERSGLTGEELDARDKRARDEQSGLTGEELDARDGLIPYRDAGDGSSGGTGSGTGPGSGSGSGDGSGSGSGSGGSGTGDGSGSGSGSGDGSGEGSGGSGSGEGGGTGNGDGGGSGGGTEMSDGGDDNPHGVPGPHGGRPLTVGHLSLDRSIGGLNVADVIRRSGVVDPSPEAAEGEDDSPREKHPTVTGTSSAAVRHSPIPQEIQRVTPHSDPRITDPPPEHE